LDIIYNLLLENNIKGATTITIWVDNNYFGTIANQAIIWVKGVNIIMLKKKGKPNNGI
jgi:hypothetical protein